MDVKIMKLNEKKEAPKMDGEQTKIYVFNVR